MRAVWLLAACALSWVMWGIAALCIAHKAQLQARVDVHRADYQQCVTIHSPPLVQDKSLIGIPPKADVT